MSDGITRRDALLAAGTIGAVGAGAVGVAGAIGLLKKDTETTTDVLVARHTAAAPPVDDPESSAWEAAPELFTPLLAQRVAPPILDTAGVGELRARALHDGSMIAFRLEWLDGDVDDLDGVDRYHDAAAVMLPTTSRTEAPAITMGGPDEPVHILQWRATWQRDLAGKSGVDQIYPRVVHDVMPDDVLPPETAALYWVGRAAGNPLSQAERTTPVEQIVAEGFGTTTHVARTDAPGKGVHDGECWRVSLGLPMLREGIGEPLSPAGSWHVAFAVWLGQQRNRGGRKHYANWVRLRLEPPA